MSRMKLAVALLIALAASRETFRQLEDEMEDAALAAASINDGGDIEPSKTEEGKTG